MADNYLQFSGSLDSLTPGEADWLGEQLAEDPPTGCPRFLLDFADREVDDTDYGFQYDFQGDPPDRYLWIFAEECGDMERVAHLVQKFLRQFRPDQCWSLTYAVTCSKPRLGEFGGGAVFVTANDIRWNDCYAFVEEQGKAFQHCRQPDHPRTAMTFDVPRCTFCGELASGTLDMVPGIALLVFDDNGQAEYAGETQIDWNDQVTYRDAEGRVTLKCPGGHQWQARLTNT